MISKDQMETLRDNFQDFLKKKLQMLQLNSIRFLDKNINFCRKSPIFGKWFMV